MWKPRGCELFDEVEWSVNKKFWVIKNGLLYLRCGVFILCKEIVMNIVIDSELISERNAYCLIIPRQGWRPSMHCVRSCRPWYIHIEVGQDFSSHLQNQCKLIKTGQKCLFWLRQGYFAILGAKAVIEKWKGDFCFGSYCAKVNNEYRENSLSN